MAYDMISDLTAASGYAAGDLIEMETAAGVSVKSTFIAAMLGNDGPASGLDAATVSGFGIGGYPTTIGADGNIDALVTGGSLYAVNVSASGTQPFPATNHSIVWVTSSETLGAQVTIKQTAMAIGTNRIKTRSKNDTTWTAWDEIWTSGNDGNGGQPPAAKSNKTSNATIGWFDVVDCASGAQVTLPSSGTFEWFVTTYGATYNSVKSGISAGGAITGTASANLTMYYKRLS